MKKPLRILHLEDMQEDAELVASRLMAEGINCEFKVVSSKTEYMTELDRGGYDIILSDYTLPDLNGREAIQMAHDKNPNAPFIYVSGTMGEDVAIESLKKGANDYVLKNKMERLAPAVLRAMAETEEKRKLREAEEKLVRSERRMAEAQQLAHVGDWEVDLRTNVATWTDELYRIFGVHPQTFTPGYESYLERLHPDDRGKIEEAIQNALIDHKPFDYDSRIVRPDGSIRMLHSRGQVFVDENNKPVKMAGTSQDITERGKLESQLLQARKMEAIGRLAGGVAHDFNNLLTVILGLCDFLLQSVPEPQRADVSEIQKAGERAASLTRQLLAFSRRQVMQPQLVNLNTVVTEVTQMLRRLLGEDIQLVIHLDPALNKIMVDPGQIEQVIVNLCVNSRDAMLQGGTLTITTLNVSMDEHAVQKSETSIKTGDYVLLGVIDNGSGMDEKTKANIFEPFFTTKGQGKGTGLGLSTVYGIIQQSGGMITVSSAVGEGTTFKIYFPQAASDVPGKAAKIAGPAPRAVPSGPATILLVEDEERVRRLVSVVLEKNGFRLLSASEGKEALEIAQGFDGEIDLLLTDVVLPGMSGLDVASRLIPLRPQMKILYTSGYTDHEIFRSSQLAVSPSFLPKPFTPAGLLQKIKEVLSLSDVKN